MRATLMYEAGDVRIEDVPDPSIAESTDAVIPGNASIDLRQRPLARWLARADGNREADGP